MKTAHHARRSILSLVALYYESLGLSMTANGLVTDEHGKHVIMVDIGTIELSENGLSWSADYLESLNYISVVMTLKGD